MSPTATTTLIATALLSQWSSSSSTTSLLPTAYTTPLTSSTPTHLLVATDNIWIQNDVFQPEQLFDQAAQGVDTDQFIDDDDNDPIDS